MELICRLFLKTYQDTQTPKFSEVSHRFSQCVAQMCLTSAALVDSGSDSMQRDSHLADCDESLKSRTGLRYSRLICATSFCPGALCRLIVFLFIKQCDILSWGGGSNVCAVYG